LLRRVSGAHHEMQAMPIAFVQFATVGANRLVA